MKLETFTIIALIILGILVLITIYSLNKARFRVAIDLSSLWKGHKTEISALAWSAALLLFLNILCSRFGWNWWHVNYANSSFWWSQFAFLLSIYVLMIPSNRWAKRFAFVLLVVMVIGWIDIAKRSSGMMTQTTNTTSQNPTFPKMLVKKGEWSVPLSPKFYQVDPVAGVKIKCDGMDSRIIDWPAETKKIFVPPEVKYIQIGSTEEDMNVTGLPVSI